MKLRLLLLFTLWSTCALAQTSTVPNGDGKELLAHPPKLVDGNALLSNCNAGIRSMDTGVPATPAIYCMAYVSGMVDGINQSTNTICTEDGVTTGQLIRVVVKYLNEHPERLHEYEGRLVFAAFSQAFPCKAAPK